jgi:DNA polymerase-3 subunit gamma/tau
MEYLVLARKWRPQSFQDLVGQEQVARTLTNAILQNRIAHAFIFSGPRGVGKTSVARILAKALNCVKGPTPTPCQVCANCREITAGNSMDVREIDGASNRGIDEIRELRENVKFSPASGRYKIYIIDEVHMLTQPAFNALLKTLEEPPSHVVFVLATTELNKIPATILSRCQSHDFRIIPLKQITEKLQRIAEAEKIGISTAGLAWIAAAGKGSLRDAQSIFDQVISYAGADIKDADVEELLGMADRRFLFLLSGAILKKDAGQCLQVINEGYYAGLDMKHFFQLLLNHFRNLLFVKIAGPNPSLFDLTEDDIAELQAQGADAARETIQRLLDILLAEEENMRRTQDSRLHLETAIVRMAYLEELIPIEEVLGRMETLEKKLTAGATKAALTASDRPNQSAAPAPAVVKLPSPSQVREDKQAYSAADSSPEQRWADYKAQVKKLSPGLGSNIEQGVFISYAEQALTVGFPVGFAFDYVRERDHLERLEELARPFFGDQVKVKFEIIKPDQGDRVGKLNGTARNNHDLRQEAMNHPLLQKAIDLFEGAEVREIIPRNNS